jgi:hypothetical protein
MFESIDRGFDMLDQHSGDWTKSCGLSRDLMGGILVKSCADFFAARLIILPVHHEASQKPVFQQSSMNAVPNRADARAGAIIELINLTTQHFPCRLGLSATY